MPSQDILLHEPWRQNLLWGVDWRWIRVGGKFMFLPVMIDWYSRKIVARGLFHQITRIKVVSVVTGAVAKEDIENLGLELWLSGVGRPTGNARTERVIGTLKRAEVLLEGEYENQASAQKKNGYAIFGYSNLRSNAIECDATHGGF